MSPALTLWESLSALFQSAGEVGAEFRAAAAQAGVPDEDAQAAQQMLDGVLALQLRAQSRARAANHDERHATVRMSADQMESP